MKRVPPRFLRGGVVLLCLSEFPGVAERVADLRLRKSQVVLINGLCWGEFGRFYDRCQRSLICFTNCGIILLLSAKRCDVIVEQEKQAILVTGALVNVFVPVQLKCVLPRVLRSVVVFLCLVEFSGVTERVANSLLREGQVVLINGICRGEFCRFHDGGQRILVGLANRVIVLLLCAKPRDVIVEQEKQAILVIGALFAVFALAQLKRVPPRFLRSGVVLLCLVELPGVAESVADVLLREGHFVYL